RGRALGRARVKNEAGNRYGRLTVIAREGSRTRSGGKRIATWLCACDCGQEAVVVGANLRSGSTRSCGCLARELAAENVVKVAVRGYRKDVVGYGAAHERVYRKRGRASQHDCVDCGERAEEWSYDHSDPD